MYVRTVHLSKLSHSYSTLDDIMLHGTAILGSDDLLIRRHNIYCTRRQADDADKAIRRMPISRLLCCGLHYLERPVRRPLNPSENKPWIMLKYLDRTAQ
jgi:hypothetical protein